MGEGLKRAAKAARATRRKPKPEVIMVTNSCGCIFCDLGVELHEDTKGYHHVAHGERVVCSHSNG